MALVGFKKMIQTAFNKVERAKAKHSGKKCKGPTTTADGAEIGRTGYMQTNSSASRVFDTVELLEMILLNLPCADLLLAQRVNSTWKATIAGSLIVQQFLGFSPVKKPTLLKLPANELLGHAAEIALHPLLDRLFHLQEVHKVGYCFAYPHGMPSIFGDPHASWRTMFLTQPIQKKMQIHRSLICRDTENILNGEGRTWHHYGRVVSLSMKIIEWYETSIHSEDGLTIGDLVEYFKANLNHHPGHENVFTIRTEDGEWNANADEENPDITVREYWLCGPTLGA